VGEGGLGGGDGGGGDGGGGGGAEKQPPSTITPSSMCLGPREQEVNKVFHRNRKFTSLTSP